MKKSYCEEPFDTTVCSNLLLPEDTNHSRTSTNNSVAQSSSKIKIHSDIKLDRILYPKISYETDIVNSVLNNVDSLVVVPPKEDVMDMPIPKDTLIIMDYDSSVLPFELNYTGCESNFDLTQNERNVCSNNYDKNINSFSTGSTDLGEFVFSSNGSNDLVSSTEVQENTTYYPEKYLNSLSDSDDENLDRSPVNTEVCVMVMC